MEGLNASKLGFLDLPIEIREKVYEHITPVSVNFIYLSPAQIPEYRQEWRVYGRKMLRQPGLPCSLRFEISPYYDEDAFNLRLVNKRIRDEVEEVITRECRVPSRVLEEEGTINGTTSYNQDFVAENINAQLLRIVSKSRFIFSGFCHNTRVTLEAMDERIRKNIKSIFLTSQMVFPNFPGNSSKWTIGRPGEDPEMSELEYMFHKNLPNLENVAVAVSDKGKHCDALRVLMEWYQKGRIKELEIVFRHRTQLAMYSVEDCYRVLYEHAMPFGAWKRWKVVRVPRDQVVRRGRYQLDPEASIPWYWEEERGIEEGTVFRMTREELPESRRADIEVDPSSTTEVQGQSDDQWELLDHLKTYRN